MEKLILCLRRHQPRHSNHRIAVAQRLLKLLGLHKWRCGLLRSFMKPENTCPILSTLLTAFLTCTTLQLCPTPELRLPALSWMTCIRNLQNIVLKVSMHAFIRITLLCMIACFFPFFYGFIWIIITAARVREILEKVGLVKESLPSNLVSSARILANVANLLDIRDTELSRLV